MNIIIIVNIINILNLSYVINGDEIWYQIINIDNIMLVNIFMIIQNMINDDIISSFHSHRPWRFFRGS